MPAGSFARFARRKKVKAEMHPDSCTTTHSPRERVSRNGFNLHSDCTHAEDMLRAHRRCWLRGFCCFLVVAQLGFWGLVPDSQDRALSVRRKSLGAAGRHIAMQRARSCGNQYTQHQTHTHTSFKCVPCTLLVRVGMSMPLLLHYV